MSRNKIATNSALFAALAQRVAPERVQALGLDMGAARYVKTTVEESLMLEHGVVAAHAFCLPGKAVAVVTHASRVLIALPGDFPETVTFRDYVGLISDDAGLATVLWGEGLVSPRYDVDLGDELAERVFGRAGGYDLAELRGYFQPVTVLEVDGTTFPPAAAGTPERILGLALCDAPHTLALPFLPDTLQEIRIVLEDTRLAFVSGAMFRALTATHWEHAFLEMYRCLERLFSIPYARDLARSASYGPSAGTMAELASIHLNWRPREDEAIVKVLSLVQNSQTLSDITAALQAGGAATSGSPAERAGRQIYGARNAIAHFRPALAGASADAWDRALHGMCAVNRELLTTLAGDL